jgi:hypothetical protein
MSAEKYHPRRHVSEETGVVSPEYERREDRGEAAMRKLAVADTVEPTRSRSMLELLRTPTAKIISGIAATAVFTGGVLIGWNNKEREEASGRAETAASAPAVPGEGSPSPSVSETLDDSTYETKTKYAPTLEQTELFGALNSEQQTEILRYKAMPLETFRQLPEEKQLVYGDFYHRATEDYASELLQQSPYYHERSGELTGRDSTGQAVVDDFAERQGELFYSLATNGKVSKINEEYRTEAQKALVTLYPQLFADSQIYKNRLSQLEGLDGLEGNDVYNPNNGDGYIIRTVEDESPTGFDMGASTKYMNVSSPTGELLQYIYNYTTFTDIYGEEKNLWRLKMIVDTGSSMYKPDLSKVFTNHPASDF